MWVFKHTTEQWDGDTHEIGGNTYSGATRTPSSRPLVWAEPVNTPSFSKQKPTEPKPRKPRPKQPPKPKGATAWD